MTFPRISYYQFKLAPFPHRPVQRLHLTVRKQQGCNGLLNYLGPVRPGPRKPQQGSVLRWGHCSGEDRVVPPWSVCPSDSSVPLLSTLRNPLSPIQISKRWDSPFLPPHSAAAHPPVPHIPHPPTPPHICPPPPEYLVGCQHKPKKRSLAPSRMTPRLKIFIFFFAF